MTMIVAMAVIVTCVAVSRAAVEDFRHSDIAEESEYCGEKHEERVVNHGFIDDTVGGFVEEDDSEAPDEDDAAECTDDFCSVVAV